MRSMVLTACAALLLLSACKSDGSSDASAGGGGDTPNEEEQPTAPENTATAPCDFAIEDISAGGSPSFDCILDLAGGSYELPPNVDLEFATGDIINGSLNFDGGTIDGRLMNASLTITGDVDLASDTFDFYPSRWDLREGTVSDAQALDNRDILEVTITQVRSMGATKLRMNQMDAYFNVTPVPDDLNFEPQVEAINIPSGFELKMTDNTHLRVQPNSHTTYALIAGNATNSIWLTGGNLHGDRYTHNYTGGSTHEWGYLVLIYGGRGVNIWEANFQDATGDAIKVQDINYIDDEDHRGSGFVTIAENSFDGNRRNHISVTGVYIASIRENVFENASSGGSGSTAGVGGGYAVEVNAARDVDSSGNITYLEKTERLDILRNVERGSRGGSFAVTSGDDVTINDNNVESMIRYGDASEIEITENRIIGDGPVGIQIGQAEFDDATVVNNKVLDNTITGFSTGMRVTGHNAEVSSNRVNDADDGIVLEALYNASVIGNVVISTQGGSRGIVAADTILSGVDVEGNTASVTANPMYMSEVNVGASDNELVLSANVLRSEGVTVFDEIDGLEFDSNILDDGVQVINVNDSDFTGNTVNAANDDGFHFQQTNTNILVQDNRITVVDLNECVVIDAGTNAAEITQQSNVCTQTVPLGDPGVPITEIPYDAIPSTSYTLDLDEWDIPSDRSDAVKTTQNMQAAFDWASENGFGIVRIPAGHYLIGEYGNDIYYAGLSLHGNTAYLFDENATMEMVANDKWNYCLIEIWNKDNVVVSGGTLLGDKNEHVFATRSDGATAHDEGHLICPWYDTDNVTIHSMIMRNATGDGVLLVGGGDGRPTVNNVHIINNDIGYNRRQGISVVGATNLLIENNEIHHIEGTSPQFGIDFEGGSRLNRDAIIRNNYFHHNRGGDIVNTDGENVLIENNVLEQGAGSSYIDGPLVYWKAGDMTVRYNDITMTSVSVNNWNGIIMYSNDSAKVNPATTYIYENVCNGCGFYMYYGADLVIRDNLMYNGHIAIRDFSNITVTNNRIIGSRGYCWPYRFLRVFGQASGNTLDGEVYDIPLSDNTEYSGCWI